MPRHIEIAFERRGAHCVAATIVDGPDEIAAASADLWLNGAPASGSAAEDRLRPPEEARAVAPRGRS